MRKIIVLTMVIGMVSVGCVKEKAVVVPAVDAGTVQAVPAGVNQNEVMSDQVEPKNAPDHASTGQ